MAGYKAGDTITRNGIDLLVLDIIDGNPFVIALDTGLENKFGDNTNYRTSSLKTTIDNWFKDSKLSGIPREVDLVALDGGKSYGQLNAICAAPLTFDEFRKYSNVLIPHIEKAFWLCTAWQDFQWSSGATAVCYVYSDGSASGYNYWGSRGVAPAFILDDNSYNLSNVSTHDLLIELAKRISENDHD